MVKAFMMMLMCESKNQNRYFSSRRYQQLRDMFAKIQSEHQSGSGNSQFETMWIHSPELQMSKKILKSDTLEEGWVKGRVIDWDIYLIRKNSNPKDIRFKRPRISETELQNILQLKIDAKNKRVHKELERQHKREQKKIERDQKIEQYREWLSIYVKVGFDEFVKVTGYKYSKPNLVQTFSKLLPEFVPQNGKQRNSP
jgi:hypothetical protein